MTEFRGWKCFWPVQPSMSKCSISPLPRQCEPVSTERSGPPNRRWRAPADWARKYRKRVENRGEWINKVNATFSGPIKEFPQILSVIHVGLFSPWYKGKREGMPHISEWQQPCGVGKLQPALFFQAYVNHWNDVLSNTRCLLFAVTQLSEYTETPRFPLGKPLKWRSQTVPLTRLAHTLSALLLSSSCLPAGFEVSENCLPPLTCRNYLAGWGSH